MTVRPPLAAGDDGSANAYPSRSTAFKDALDSATRKLAVAVDPGAWLDEAWPGMDAVEALSTPFDPTTSTATAEDERYAVIVTVDGERLDVPMHIRRGRDYHGTGEYLVSIARRLGVNLMDSRPRIADYTVMVEIAEMPGEDCTGDWSPVVLAAATTFRPPSRLPNTEGTA